MNDLENPIHYSWDMTKEDLAWGDFDLDFGKYRGEDARGIAETAKGRSYLRYCFEKKPLHPLLKKLSEENYI